MRKLFFCIIATFIVFSCKDDNNDPDTSRGALVDKPVVLASVLKTDIAAAIKYAAPDYASKINTSYDVQTQKVVYYTIDNEGITTKASGLLLVPVNAGKALPLVSYQHGTELSDENVPSRQKSEYIAALVFAAQGYVVSCPDYLGLGDSPGIHPYVHAKTEATAVIDMLRASKKICADIDIPLNEDLFLVGYSQGGHATLATLKAMEEQYTTEFSVKACAPLAGPYDLSGTQFNYLMRDSAYTSPGYLPYVIFAYSSVYRTLGNLQDIFEPTYYSNFKQIFADNTTYELADVDKLWSSSSIPSAVLKPEVAKSMKEDENNPFRIALKNNDLYNWTPQAPIQMCHCDSDATVPIGNAYVAYNSFIKNGSKNVTLINPLPGGTHYTCALPSLLTTLIWFNSIRSK